MRPHAIIFLVCAFAAACGGQRSGLDPTAVNAAAVAAVVPGASPGQGAPISPLPVATCPGQTAGDACSVKLGDKTVDGVCQTLPGAGTVECLPLPPPPPANPAVTPCDGKAAGDACSVTLGDKTVDGVCEALPGASTVVCLPLPPSPPANPLLTSCDGKAAGDACSVTLGAKTLSGVCNQVLLGGPLTCLPPS